MDHDHFKGRQTAAVYVAEGLDDTTLEAFELHLLRCTECLWDVESWRAIKNNIPAGQRSVAGPLRTTVPFGDWRIAASFLGAGVIGVTGGWVGKSINTADLDSTQTVVFALSGVTRGSEECQTVRLAANTRVAVLRVAGISSSERITAFNSDKRALPEAEYSSRIQTDGSHLLRLNYQVLAGRAVHLRTEAADGFTEPMACIVGQVVSEGSGG